MQDGVIYAERAALYDLIYHWKRYDEEAAALHDLLLREDVADGASVLEAACGTGSHMLHLRRWYDVRGFDRSAAMLEIARLKLPGAELFQADMTSFRLDRPVRALLCLFSSIGYLPDDAALRAAARCFAEALGPGGILVVEPWMAPDAFHEGHPAIDTFESGDLKLCRACVSRRCGDRSILDFHWLAARRGATAVEHFTERHELRMTPPDELTACFEQAGFACRWESGLSRDRGLLLGRRR